MREYKVLRVTDGTFTVCRIVLYGVWIVSIFKIFSVKKCVPEISLRLLRYRKKEGYNVLNSLLTKIRNF